MRKFLMTVVMAACVCAMLGAAPVQAAEGQEAGDEVLVPEPVDLGDARYGYIISAQATASAKGSEVTSFASIICNKSCTITITMNLERVISGSWTTIRTWSETSKGTSARLSKTLTSMATGTQYRVVVSFSADGEKSTLTSNVSQN